MAILHPEPVSAILVNVAFKWNGGCAESLHKEEGILNRDRRVLPSVPDKTWWGFGTDVLFCRELLNPSFLPMGWNPHKT